MGVNRFRNTGIAPLNYAVNDARSVAQTVTALGFPAHNITTLLDTQATRGEIERVLSSVVRRATSSDDRLLIFFATHGMTVPLPGGGEEGYLVAHDTDPTDLPFTAFSMSALKQMGQRIPARHILVAVDACYGGYSLVRAQAPPTLDKRYLELLTQSRVIQVLTAGRKNQLVHEEQGHGVFTRKFLDGLQGHADVNRDGLITGTELAAWMHPRVAQASDNKQDMQFGNLDGEGQFFFILPHAGLSTPSTGTQVAVGTYPPQPQPPPAAIVGNDGAEMVLVPAGEFIMGSDKDEIDRLLQGWTNVKREFFDREIPRHRVYLDAFYIDRFVLGDRIANTALDILEGLVEASHLREKRAVLGTVNLKLERLRYLIRMSKDLQLLSLRKYEYVAREMNEVGAMLGGWLKQQRSREP